MDPFQSTVVVVNPASGGGRTQRSWPKISAMLHRRLGSIEAVLTQAAGDATRLTREALRGGADRVVALGGDGTLHEVINGFFESDARTPIKPDATLGLIPLGTGGDFKRSLDLDNDLDAAVKALVDVAPRPIDLGRAQFIDNEGAPAQRVFANVASVGMSGEICANVNRSSKRLGGKLTFFGATAKAFVGYENAHLRILYDGKQTVQRLCNTLAICNGRYFGGGMHMAPPASLDDGDLEVVEMGDIGLAFFLRNQGRLYRGEHLSLAEIAHRPAASVEVESLSEVPVLIELDGEQPGRLPASFECLPGAIRIQG